VQNAVELNGITLDHMNKRILAMNALDLISWMFAHVMDGRDAEQRRYIMAHMTGRIGPNGGIIAEGDHLPEDLQGKEMPSWYNEADDPWSKTITANL